MVPLDVHEGAAPGPQALEGPSDLVVVRALQVGGPDPDGEQISEDRQGADVARQAVEEPDERADLGVPLPQVGVTQEDDGRVRQPHRSVAHQVGEPFPQGELLHALRAQEILDQVLDEAMQELKRAVALVPDDPVIIEHLGDIFLELKMFREAQETWERSLQLQPENEAVEGKLKKVKSLLEQRMQSQQ